MMIRLATALLFLTLAASAQAGTLGGPPGMYMETMTWQEIRDRIAAGSDVAIIPIGGTEQNGPQMIISKQTIVARYTAGEIAKKLGNALVAPVIPYAPAGRIDPPEGHMKFPGTISMSSETFAHVLEDAATSLKQNGFRTICFISESGGSQSVENQVAGRLTQDWQANGIRVLDVSDYNNNNGQEAWADSIGVKVQNSTAHAGLIDTSEMMAVNPTGVRGDLRGVRTERDYRATGAMGDSTKASADYGRRFLSLKINAAVAQIQDASHHSQ